MKFQLRAPLLGGASLIIALAVSLARADQVVDQTTLLSLNGGLGYQSVNVTQDLAQTFIVTRDGFLTEIDLQLLRSSRYDTISHDLRIDLVAPTNSTSPLGTVLTSFALRPSA